MDKKWNPAPSDVSQSRAVRPLLGRYGSSGGWARTGYWSPRSHLLTQVKTGAAILKQIEYEVRILGVLAKIKVYLLQGGGSIYIYSIYCIYVFTYVVFFTKGHLTGLLSPDWDTIPETRLPFPGLPRNNLIGYVTPTGPRRTDLEPRGT